LNLPANYGAIQVKLDNKDYNPKTGVGILFTSPLSIAGKTPQKISTAFVGGSHKAVKLLEEFFLAKFKRE